METKLVFSSHAKDQLADRGTNEAEVAETVREGERQSAKHGRISFRKNFPFEKEWKGRYYSSKQVMPIVAEESDRLVVVTVYVFYFGGRQ